MIFMCTFFVGDNMKNDIYYMNLALKEAKKALLTDDVPIGAVVVRNGKIVSRGHNTKNSKNNVIKHAEIIAIEKACTKLDNWRLNDCTIYVTMIPCPMCASAINQARINKVVYGTVPNSFNKELVMNIFDDKYYGNPVSVVENVLEKECSELLKKFFLEKR